jgi:hypothetical protein
MSERSRGAAKAYRNRQFLNSRDARALRILSEYLEPKARFERYRVEDTIVFMGSARIRSPAAAAEAKRKAIAFYLAYRRDGGENHHPAGRICLAVTQSLLAGDPAQAASLLQQQLPRLEAAGFGGFIRALQAIVTGRRDRTLADAPDLSATMAAEILFLIETLEKPR